MTSPNIGTLEVEIRANFDRLVRDLETRLRAINQRSMIKLRAQLVKGTLNKVNRQLKSFTGFNALTNEFTKGAEAIRGAFDNIGKLSRRLVLFGGLLGPLTVGVGALSTAIIALGTAAAGALVALPGLLLGAGAAFFVFKTAAADAKKILEDSLKPYGDIKKIISENFWEKATKGVRTLLDSAIEPLKEGFGTLSTAMGSFTGKLATSISKAFSPDVYKAFFDGLSSAFDILTKSGFTEAFASIAKQLVVFSGQIFPMIAKGISDITIRFDEFLKRNPTFMMDSFKTLLEVLKGIVAVGVGLWGIFQAIATAATAAGVGTGSFGEALKGIAEKMKAAGFQEKLTAFFVDAKAGMAGLRPAFEALGGLLGSLAPIIGNFIRQSGESLGMFFGELFTQLNKPDVLANISKGFEGIAKAFENLTPVAGTMAKDFGNLIGFAGTLADEFSKNLAAAIQVISPIMDAILPSIEKLTKALGEFFRTKISDLKPQLEGVGKAFTSLIDGVTQFVEALNTPVLRFIMNLITDFIVTAVKGVFNLVGGILKVVAGLAKVLSGDFSGFAQIFEGLKSIITGAFQLFITLFAPAKILGLVGRLFPRIGSAVLTGVTGLVKLIGQGFSALPGLMFRALGAIVTRIPGVAQSIGGSIISGITRGIQALIGGALSQFFDWLVGGIKSLLGINSPSTVFAEIGGFLVQGLIDGIKALIGGVAALFLVPIEAIKTAFTAAFEVIKVLGAVAWDFIKQRFLNLKANITLGINIVKAVVSAVWNILKAAGGAVWDFIKQRFSNMKANIQLGIAIVKAVVSAVWTALKAAGEKVWSSITGAFNTMKGGLSRGVDAIKSKFTGAFDSIKKKVREVYNWIKDKIPKIKIPGLSSLGKLPGFASGVTNFSGGMAVVGERGPELVRLPRGSDVYSNQRSKEMLSNQDSGGFNINGNIIINEAGRAPAESLPRALRNLAFTMGVA